MSAITCRARAMRKALTPPEARLWRDLKRLRGEGWQIRRQAPFRGYFLDFVCFSRRLVIEVDGSFHGVAERIRRDAIRDAVLEREGFLTLRMPAIEIRDNMDGVMRLIRARLAERPQTRSPAPLPRP